MVDEQKKISFQKAQIQLVSESPQITSCNTARLFINVSAKHKQLCAFGHFRVSIFFLLLIKRISGID